MKKLLVIFLACASSLFAQESRKGTLCFGTECTAVSGATFEVKPADVERRYVWTSSAGTSFVLGTLPANATSIDLDAKDASNVTFVLEGSSRRGWPLDTRFTVAQARTREWKWSVPAKVVTRPFSIRMPRGSYSLLIEADHHSQNRRMLKVEANDVALNTVRLNPLPVITGRVVTTKKSDADAEPKEVPLAGAQLMRDAKPIAAANEQGTFRVELAEPPIKEIVIASPGLASKTVPLNLTSPDFDLGTITLAPGVKLTVHLDRDSSVKSKTIHAQLSRMTQGQYEHTKLVQRDIAPTEDEVVFADLADGEYFLTLSGDGALEHLTTAIRVKTHDEKENVHIEPFQLAGSVALGSDPVRDGKVGIHDRDHTWTAETPIDAEGHFTGTMWQREGIGGWVISGQMGTLPVDDNVKLSGDPAPWDIRFRNRLITGHVLDEETKQAIAHASLSLQMEAHDAAAPQPGGTAMRRLYTNVPVSDDGSFSIVAVHDGVYDLEAKAPDHVAGNVTVEIAANDESKRADLLLTSGVQQTIEFVWPSGEPIPNAEVIEGVARDGYNPAWLAATDASGVLNLRMRANEKKTLYVLPRGGSFAAVHVVGPSGAGAKPMHVVVPPPAGGLALRIVDADGKPVRRAAILMTYNGEPVPQPVVLRLRTFPTSDGRRITALPAGAYELWGVRVNGVGPVPAPTTAPLHVSVTSGEQQVEIVLP